MRVLIAEDMHMFRRTLVTVLGMEPDIDVVAEVSSGAEILARARSTRPDVAIIDIDLPHMDGLTAAVTLHSLLPRCRTLLLAGTDRPGALRRALAARAAGYLLKDTDPRRLASAIRSVWRGERVYDRRATLAALEQGPPPLSAREIQVLRLASQGHEPQHIGRTLFLSTGTVRNYLTAIVNKLRARNRMDAVRIARESGWL